MASCWWLVTNNQQLATNYYRKIPMKAKNKTVSYHIVPPEANPDFIGHKDAVKILYDSAKSGKMPNAWLLSGSYGIGKATLAYRFARFILAGGSEENLHVDESHPAFAKMKGGSHSDLMVIKIQEGKDIKVDDVRKINDFLRLTSAETPYRIVIIDSADDMNNNAANAVLKLLEEPPHKAMFLLVSHAPGRLLPTIRSRCRKLEMRPLDKSDAKEILQLAVPGILYEESMKLAALSKGSPGLAIKLYQNKGLELYGEIMSILAAYPKMDMQAVHKLGDKLSGKDSEQLWEVFTYIISFILTSLVSMKSYNINEIEINNGDNQAKNKLIVEKSLEELMKIWDKVNLLMNNTSHLNLSKKAVVINIFQEL